MKEYLVVYQNGNSEKVSFPDKRSLINEMFNGDEEKFKKEVTRLIWSSLTIHYVEDVKSEKVDSEIISADVNPYGWRNS